MGTYFKTFIESKGGNLNEIYAALDSDDLAQLVRATTNELKKVNWNPCNMHLPKAIEASAQLRIEGNEHYNAGRKRLAIELYNKAIAFAPPNSVELELALGNRSAVFYSIKYYTGCVDDIRLVAEILANKKKSLADKLKKRLELAMLCMHHERTVGFITNIPFTTTFLDFRCKKNADVPCVSAQVAFTNDKRIKVKTAIMPGTLVGIERAYVACTDWQGRFVSCYYCHRLDLCLVPCVGCTVLFCDNNCMKLCFKEYHSIECHVMIYISLPEHVIDYQLMRKTAIKLYVKLGWDAFIEESKNIGLSRMKNSSVEETFDSRITTSILSYDDTDKHLIEGKIFNASFYCAGFLQLLEDIPFFPEDIIKKAEAWDAMARVMLRLCVTYNKIHIKCSAQDFQSEVGPFKSNAQINYGWFSMSSKLKHSCTPNLQVVGLNDSIGLVALRTIKEEEELTICYFDHFSEITLTKAMPQHHRSLHILILYGFICQCEVCTNNWDANSAIDIQMTKKQVKLYKKVDKETREMSFSSFYDLCNVLDRFPINSRQHHYAYKNMLDMLKPVQSKYRQNKTYSSDNETMMSTLQVNIDKIIL